MSKTATSPQAWELAERIRHRIQSEQLSDGSFFMTEAQLAEEYDASHTVTREAVSRLQALGILEGRKRKGLIVRHPDLIRLLSHSMPSLLGSEEDGRELEVLRYVIEVGAIELAVKFGTAKQIEELTATMDRLETALLREVDQEAAYALDLQFHLQILQMTGAKLVMGMQEVLVRFFQAVSIPLALKKEFTPELAERIVWEHRELCNAIRARDVEHARALIRLQFRQVITQLEQDEVASNAANDESAALNSD
ncbi:FadR/GntR family transcriptional regulator [Planctomicrobium sp. SH661]|uniref:FadR/GntR family transcriptional regulator n=1 Tax=Planctomicrobium sp. SH661 TaxID=3448124 RepID=UPI003F5C80B6